MTVLSRIAASTAKSIARLGDLFTYESVTPELGENACPYLGHVPYFASKLTLGDKHRLSRAAR